MRTFQAGRLDAGLNHTCAIVATGAVWCWGSDEFGQLGNDPAFGVGVVSDTPVPVALPAARTATSVSAGRAHTCAILDDGSVWCWGRDEQAELGNDIRLVSSGVPVHVPLPSGLRAVSLSAGDRHSCVAMDDGTVWCWGTEGSGELGDGPEPYGDAPTPVQALVPADRKAGAVSAGGDHSCAAMTDGTVWCWGADSSGQLGTDIGDPPTTDPQIRVEPVQTQLPAGSRASALSAGRAGTCATLNTGGAWCWGADYSGQLGNNTTYLQQPLPQPVTLLRDVSAISTSSGDSGEHTCAVSAGDAVACWGADDRGQLGDDVGVGGSSPVPVGAALPGGHTAVAVATGGPHTCATLNDGSLTCWGSDANGELGNGPGTANVAVPATAPLTLPPGSMVAHAVDASIAIAGLPAKLPMGRSAKVTLTVRNAGPDVATGLRIALRTRGLRVARPVLGGGPRTPVWSPAPVAAGGQTQIVVTIAAQAPGAGLLTAEIVGAGEPDLDSTPGDAKAGADDIATAAAKVSGPRRVIQAQAGVGVAQAGGRLSVRAFTVLKVVRGDQVSLKCVRGCRLARTTLAEGTRVSFGTLFKQLRLSSGSVIDVRVTNPGAIGRAIRVTLVKQGTAVRPVRRECRIQLSGRLTNCVAR